MNLLLKYLFLQGIDFFANVAQNDGWDAARSAAFHASEKRCIHEHQKRSLHCLSVSFWGEHVFDCLCFCQHLTLWGQRPKRGSWGGAPAKTWLWKLQKHDVRRSKKEAESLEQTKLWAWPPLQWEQWKQMWLTDNKWSSRSTWYSTVTTAAPASSAHVCSQNLSKSKCAVSSLRQNTTQMFPERSNEQTNSLHGKTMCLCHKALMTDVRFINGFLFWDWWSRHEVCESELQGREILFNVQISHLFWLYFTNSMN